MLSNLLVSGIEISISLLSLEICDTFYIYIYIFVDSLFYCEVSPISLISSNLAMLLEKKARQLR
jgi:hypothetical protein